MISSLTLMTLFLLLRHFPCAAAGGIGYPFITTSRSRLVFKYTSMRLSPKAKAPTTLRDLAADYLARNGYAVVSVEMAALADSIEARLAIGVAVPSREFEAVLHAIYAGPYGDYHQPKVFA